MRTELPAASPSACSPAARQIPSRWAAARRPAAGRWGSFGFCYERYSPAFLIRRKPPASSPSPILLIAPENPSTPLSELLRNAVSTTGRPQEGKGQGLPPGCKASRCRPAYNFRISVTTLHLQPCCSPGPRIFHFSEDRLFLASKHTHLLPTTKPSPRQDEISSPLIPHPPKRASSHPCNLCTPS